MDTQLANGQVISSMDKNIDDLWRVVKPLADASSSGQGDAPMNSDDEDE